MNERIRELVEQAGINVSQKNYEGVQHVYYWVESAAGIEKFAELIVKECLEACSRANEIRHFVPPTQEQVVLSCMREIEHHFGVEE
jgi:hypothetical protein